MRRLCGMLCLVLLAAPARGEDVASLVQKLKAEDVDSRRQAANELAVQARQLKQASEQTKKELKAATPAVFEAMKDPDPFVRRYATQAIGYLAPDDQRTLEALTKALKDDRRVVEAAAESLGQVGAGGVKPLGELARDKNKETAARKKALSSLTALGPKAKDAVPVLMELLKDREVRTEAALTLAAVGPEAKDALKTLEEMAALRDRDQNFKRAVNSAIAKIKKTR